MKAEDNYKRPLVLTIAGFDPTGGAGILADVKVFEQHRCLGFAVNTANTIQTEDDFASVNWVNEDLVFEQLNKLFECYVFSYVKLGIMPSLDFVKRVVHCLKESNPNVCVIWDPVLASSSGFTLLDKGQDFSGFVELVSKVFLITPNWNEVKRLSNEDDAQKGAKRLSEYVNVYLKGGHNDADAGKDYLYPIKGKTYPLNPKNKREAYAKHGSGCVFSASLLSNMALGYPVLKAALRAKRYTERVLVSNKSLLGYHTF